MKVTEIKELNLVGWLGEEIEVITNDHNHEVYINIHRPITGMSTNTILSEADALVLANFILDANKGA